MFDSYHDHAFSLVDSLSISADTDGTAIDMEGYNSLTFVVYVGANSSYASNASFALEVEHADESTVTEDTAGTYADVSATYLLGAISGTTTGRFALVDDTDEDDTIYKVGYTGGKRYVRVHYEMDGSPGASTFRCIAIRGHKTHNPATA